MLNGYIYLGKKYTYSQHRLLFSDKTRTKKRILIIFAML